MAQAVGQLLGKIYRILRNGHVLRVEKKQAAMTMGPLCSLDGVKLGQDVVAQAAPLVADAP
jgi:hypothetical protein